MNGIDWLSDDTGLIELRTKGVSSRPIKQMEDHERSLIKWINFLLPILLVLMYGVFVHSAVKISESGEWKKIIHN